MTTSQLMERCTYCQRSTVVRYRGSPFRRCRCCDLVLRLPRPSPAQLAELYERSWLDPRAHSAETGGMSPALARSLVAELERTLEERGAWSLRGARVLEFGAGSGSLARALRQRGAEVRTVEPFGHEGLCASGFENVRSLLELPEDVRFDGITSFDVVEHLIEPWIDLRELKGRLAPGGWLLVSTPNVKGLNALLSGSRWRELNKPGHITMFSPRTLVTMLEGLGFENVRRLHWRVDYGRRLSKKIAGSLLQATRLDGALRVFATAPRSESSSS